METGGLVMLFSRTYYVDYIYIYIFIFIYTQYIFQDLESASVMNLGVDPDLPSFHMIQDAQAPKIGPAVATLVALVVVLRKLLAP
jgi:hypothetical protein